MPLPRFTPKARALRPYLLLSTGAAASYAVYKHHQSNSLFSFFQTLEADAQRSAIPGETLQPQIPKYAKLPSRAEQIARLKSAVDDDSAYDLLIIGAGATGSGIALDAASRGLKVAMVEREDFAAGTSSKSTKLVHGGVRYLEKAVKELDYNQYLLVREALRERAVFLKTAPHLSMSLEGFSKDKV